MSLPTELHSPSSQGVGKRNLKQKKQPQQPLPNLDKQQQQPPSNKDQLDEAASTSTTTTTAITTTSPIMKLIVRSKYWGRKLEGKIRRSQDNPDHAYRVISSQAVLDKVGAFWGCCPHHGKRVLELGESHFAEHAPGQWDLYYVGSIPFASIATIYHELFLLPHHQMHIDVTKHVVQDGWKLMGAVDASMVRLGLDEHLAPYLNENKQLGRNKNHVHIQILMDQATDREITRSKGKKGQVKDTTDITGANMTTKTRSHTRSEEWPDDLVSAQPPIPHAVSHDSSSHTTPDTASNVTTFEEGWFPQSQMMCYPTASQYWGGDTGSYGYFDTRGYLVPMPVPNMNHQHPHSHSWAQPLFHHQAIPIMAHPVHWPTLAPNPYMMANRGHMVQFHDGMPFGFVDPMHGGPEQFLNTGAGFDDVEEGTIDA
jgi:hypothetical protein